MSRLRKVFLPFALVCAAICAPEIVLAQGTPSETHADLTGPFLHFGGVLGTVNSEASATPESHAGGGWSVGAGLNIRNAFALVGNYTIFNFRDNGAPSTSPMEQTEFGVRCRIGGVKSPAVFYVEGGGSMRRTTLNASRFFGTSAGDATVDAHGWAGWFGPGAQLFFGRRLAAEASVAWAWGPMSQSHVDAGAADPAVSITTLRLRAGLSATLF